MTAKFQPPPTWALPILVDEKTGKALFNPVWLKWFVDLSANLGPGGAGAGVTATGDLTTNELLVGAGTSTLGPLGTLGTSHKVLHGNAGGLPSFSPVNLTNDVLGGLVFNVRDFGALGDGTTDDTVTIQATIDACGAAGGGIVWLPPGTYKITATLTVGSNYVTLRGAGRGATIIAPAFASGDHIYATGRTFFNLYSLQVLPTVAQTSGASIHLVNCHAAVLRDFKLDGGTALTGKMNDCVWIEGGADQFLTYIEDFEMGNCIGRGIYIGGSTLVQDTFVANGVIAGCGAEGILMTYCSGVYLAGTFDIIGCGGNGIATFPAGGQYCTALFFAEVLADSCGDCGIALIDNGGTVTDINMTGTWSATNTNYGIITSSAVNGLAAVGVRVINNGKHGIYLQGGTNISFTGYQVFDNGTAANNTYDGISIAANVSHFKFTSGNSGHGGRMAVVASNMQRWGLLIDTGTSDYYVVQGNDFTGNVSGSISDSGSGTHKFVVDNPPDASGSSGVTSFNTRTGAVTLSAADVKTVLATPGGNVDVGDTIRATAINVPASGAGVEIAYDPSGTPVGWLLCYNRTGAAYVGMNISAASFNISTSGTTAATVSSGQIWDFAHNPTVGGNAFGTGTVTSVGGTGTVNGLTLSGTVTTSGNLTLGGAVAAPAGTLTGSALASGVTSSSLTSLGTLTSDLKINTPAVSSGAGILSLGNTTQATANAGAGGALPATVNGYLIIYLGSTKLAIPCYLP